jgi:hypothetical protein
VLLDDRGHEAVRIALQARGDRGVQLRVKAALRAEGHEVR